MHKRSDELKISEGISGSVQVECNNQQSNGELEKFVDNLNSPSGCNDPESTN